MAIKYFGMQGDWSPLPNFSNSIWTNGCYDILHLGHLELLQKCKEESLKEKDCLVFVGIDSDERIKKTKGINRPINNEISRTAMLLSLKYVDGVFVFDSEEDLIEILYDLKPSKMIIGDDYKDKNVVGSEYTKEVIFFPKVKDFSTSNIIKQIKNV